MNLNFSSNQFINHCRENHITISKYLSMPPQKFETFYKRLEWMLCDFPDEEGMKKFNLLFEELSNREGWKL